MRSAGGAGIGAGLIVLVAAARSQAIDVALAGMNVLDPATMIAVGSWVAAITLPATYFPARRALRLLPVEALWHR